jgi:hypothetical protein
MVTFEQIHQAIPALSAEQRRMLYEYLALKVANDSKAVAEPADHSLDVAWLTVNQSLYRGHWVALKEGTLIAHSPDFQEFARAVKSSGVVSPLIHHIPPDPSEPQVGAWDILLSESHAASIH